MKDAGIPFEYEPQRYSLGRGLGTYLPDVRLTPTVFVEITGWDKPGKAEKRRLFVTKYGYDLRIISQKPTEANMATFVTMCKEVVFPDV